MWIFPTCGSWCENFSKCHFHLILHPWEAIDRLSFLRIFLFFGCVYCGKNQKELDVLLLLSRAGLWTLTSLPFRVGKINFIELTREVFLLLKCRWIDLLKFAHCKKRYFSRDFFVSVLRIVLVLQGHFCICLRLPVQSKVLFLILKILFRIFSCPSEISRLCPTIFLETTKAFFTLRNSSDFLWCYLFYHEYELIYQPIDCRKIDEQCITAILLFHSNLTSLFVDLNDCAIVPCTVFQLCLSSGLQCETIRKGHSF